MREQFSEIDGILDFIAFFLQANTFSVYDWVTTFVLWQFW